MDSFPYHDYLTLTPTNTAQQLALLLPAYTLQSTPPSVAGKERLLPLEPLQYSQPAGFLHQSAQPDCRELHELRLPGSHCHLLWSWFNEGTDLKARNSSKDLSMTVFLGTLHSSTHLLKQRSEYMRCPMEQQYRQSFQNHNTQLLFPSQRKWHEN